MLGHPDNVNPVPLINIEKFLVDDSYTFIYYSLMVLCHGLE